MKNHTALKRHAGLTDDMACALGVDLQHAALSALVSPDEISDAVLRCTGCSDPDHCQSWLSQNSETAARGPRYCRNSELFETLVEKLK